MPRSTPKVLGARIRATPSTHLAPSFRTNRSAQIEDLFPLRDARTRNTSPSGKKVLHVRARDLFPVPFGERLHVRAPPKVLHVRAREGDAQPL